LTTYIVFTFTVRYLRFRWDICFRFHELVSVDKDLVHNFPQCVTDIIHPARYNKMFFTHDKTFLDERVLMITKYLQEVLDCGEQIIMYPSMLNFLESGAASFNPDLGRKGKEGWLKKKSGGYLQGFSRKTGDYIGLWKWCWIMLQDNCISWFDGPIKKEVVGSLQIDQNFEVFRTGRVLTITTSTRRVLFFAQTTRLAEQWELAFRNFYQNCLKTIRQPHESSYPPREKCIVKIYTTPKDYYQSLAFALLNAQKEIFITSWKNSPTVSLTRPPLPPLRFDQILKYKADQGLQIYILLYKEVEGVGQGNDSAGAKKKLESLSPGNIHVIRHPNKFLGGSIAVLWSHHEKLVIIDR
jgi:phospholipase D1/2